MPSENGKTGMLRNLTPKQKGMAAAIVVIVLILLYLMKGMFGGGSVPETTIKPSPAPTAMSATAPPGAVPARNPTPTAAMGNTPTGQQPAANAMPVPVKASIPQDVSLLSKQKEDQEKYIDSVNRLQMLKLEKDIAETNQAISAANLATKTAEKNINELFVKPAPPPVTTADYAAKLGGPATTPTPAIVTPPPEAPGLPPGGLAPPEQPEIPYVVISVTMIAHKWSAVMGYQGKLYHVSVGDVLPVDGSRVLAINKSGVIIQKDSKRRKVSLVSAI